MTKLFAAILAVILLVSTSAPQTRIGRGASTAGGGASDFITDSFTETGTGTINLNTHTGELGATWTQHPHANYSGTTIVVDRTLDRIYTASGTSAYYASGVPSSADYRVCSDFHHVSTIAVNIAIAGRMDTTADTMYIARFTDGTTWHVRKIVSGTATTIGSSTNNIPTAGNFKNGCLYMVGDQIRFEVEGVAEIGPVTDSAITAAGRAGVRTTGVSSSTTGIHIDNFSARQ